MRVVINAQGEVVERNDYYPFGLRWDDSESQISDNRYRYNAKEEQTFVNVPYIDYGARMYDPCYNIRWNGVDPKAEDYFPVSPYAFCGENPLNYIDKDGKRRWPVAQTYNSGERRHENNYGATRGNRIHQGVDINIGTGSADLGAAIYATHDGFVTRLVNIKDGDKNAGGTRIQITSAMGEVSTYYMHLRTVDKNITKGSFISEGMQIGTLGASGFGKEDAYSTHLHYEVRVNGETINPVENDGRLLDPQVLIAPIDGGKIKGVIITGQRPPLVVNFPPIRFMYDNVLKK